MIEIHNEYRARHGSPPLEHNVELSLRAQRFAKYSSELMSVAYSDREIGDAEEETLKVLGENISVMPVVQSSPAEICKIWYDQKVVYNWEYPGYGFNHADFCQMIWKDTTHVGFGKIDARGDDDVMYSFVIANYYPEGNTLGGYEKNIVKSSEDYIK